MQAPASFEQALKRYDALLSLRWGPFVQAWVVDRRAPRGISRALWDVLEQATKLPTCEPIDRERYLSAKLGNRPVLHTKILGNHVFDTLWRDDMQVHGRTFVDRHLQAMDARKAKRRDDDTHSRVAADAVNFLERRRKDASTEEKERVFQEASGKLVQFRKRKVEDKLGTPPSWMGKDAATIGV